MRDFRIFISLSGKVKAVEASSIEYEAKRGACYILFHEISYIKFAFNTGLGCSLDDVFPVDVEIREVQMAMSVNEPCHFLNGEISRSLFTILGISSMQ